MLLVKDTQESNSKFFALQDIEARSTAAYNKHKSFFNSTKQQAKAQLVEDIVGKLFVGKRAIYWTPRANKQGAYTEVKFDRVDLYPTRTHRTLKAQVVAQLEALGLDLIYKPKTNSYSVHVK